MTPASPTDLLADDLDVADLALDDLGMNDLAESGDLEPTLEEVLRAAVLAAADKKAERPIVLQVGPLLGIVEAFVICSAGNDRHVRTIADEIERQVKEMGGGSPRSIEGLQRAEWVLMDYGSFVAHIFQEESRAFYDLERLWKDAPRMAVPELDALPA